MALLTAGLLGVAVPTASADAAPASTVTFGVQPAAGAGDSRADLSYGLAAGSTATDRVAVVNYSNRALPLRVYGADATGSAASFTLAAADATSTGVGAWLSFDGMRSLRLDVPARTTGADGSQLPGRTLVPVDLTVAARATAGEHAGGVVVSLDSAAATASGAGVAVQQRVALRVYVDVAAGDRPSPSAPQAMQPAAEEHRSSHPAVMWTGVIVLLILLGFALSRARRHVLARRKNP